MLVLQMKVCLVIGADGQRFGPFSRAVGVAPSYENGMACHLRSLHRHRPHHALGNQHRDRALCGIDHSENSEDAGAAVPRCLRDRNKCNCLAVTGTPIASRNHVALVERHHRLEPLAATPERFFSVQPAPLPLGKNCNRWNSRHGEASNPHKVGWPRSNSWAV